MFVVILGIMPQVIFLKFLYGSWSLRQFWNITSGMYANYHLQIILLFVYTTTARKRFVIFTCRYFKLSWNATTLSQSNCRNFSYSSYKLFFYKNFVHWRLKLLNLLMDSVLSLCSHVDIQMPLNRKYEIVTFVTWNL